MWPDVDSPPLLRISFHINENFQPFWRDIDVIANFFNDPFADPDSRLGPVTKIIRSVESARKLTRSAAYFHKVEHFFNVSNDCIYLYRILCVFNNRFHMEHNNGNKNRPNIIFSVLKYFNVSTSVHWKALRCSQAIQLSIALLFFRNVFTWLYRRFKWFCFVNKKHNTFKYDFTYNEYI